MTDLPTVLAIVAAHNEADVIRPCVEALIADGVDVYLLDHASDDGTADAVADLVGRGLVRIEPFVTADEGGPGPFDLRRILTRKLQVAAELGYDWVINHDADEFRESPWLGVGLREGIARVAALGYDAIDFEVLEFRPTDDRFQAGDDPRTALPFYRAGFPCNRAQVRCWRHQAEPVDLLSTGGHDTRFPGRRVFPIRFLLRHYPFRTQAQAERKLFRERRPRYAEDERDLGWHVHYDDLGPDHAFVEDPTALRPFDALATRHHLQTRTRAVEALERDRDRWREEADALRGALGRAEAQAAAVEARVEELLASRSWRMTAPLRAVVDLADALRRPR